MRRQNIFESVRFLNENISLALFGGLVLAGTAVIAVASIKDKIDRESDKKRIKSSLKNLAEGSCKNISNRIKTTKSISRELLYEKIPSISEDEKYKLNSSDIAIYGVIDDNDNILAYIIIDNNKNGVIYGLVDKSIKGEELQYVYSLLEFKINYYGRYLKKVVGDLKKNLPGSVNGIQRSNIKDINSDDEKRLYKDIKDITDKFISFMKTKFPNGKFSIYIDKNYNIHNNSTDPYAIISIHDKNEPDFYKDEESYEKYWKSDADKFIKAGDVAFKDFCKKYNLQNGKGSIDNYPYIHIEHDNNPDDEITLDFKIDTVI